MKKKSTMANSCESGVVLIVCMIILLMLSLIGIASITTSNSEMQVAGNEMKSTGAFYAAEAGLEEGAAALVTSYETSGEPPNPLPHGFQTMNHYQYIYSTTDMGPATLQILSQGSYKGLYGMIKSFEVASSGADNNLESGITLTLGFEDALIPIFQFAAFYENDLEIANLPSMTLGGRVHTNSDLYLQTWSSLSLDSRLTAAGNLYHGNKSGSGLDTPTEDVLIMDANGAYQSMRNADGTFLDSRDADWVNESLSRWGGMVGDGSHGIGELNMPMSSSGSPSNIIDRGDGNPDSFEHKAGLKLVDGQALYLQGDGSWLNVTAALISGGALSYSTFYDGREGRDVSALDVDIDLLNNSGYFPTNGIIYSSQLDNGGNMPAIRLKNGQQIRGPLTVATDNPLYTWGNFNTVNKQPASFLADAVTILSNDWDDSRSTQGLGSRQPSATQVNASYMAGNTETGASGHNFNGGFNNLLRFLEDWGESTEFIWQGSAACLWYSRQANAPWSYRNYYTAPRRNWGFDQDLLDPNNLPPGAPRVNVTIRTFWKQEPLYDFSLFSG